MATKKPAKKNPTVAPVVPPTTGELFVYHDDWHKLYRVYKKKPDIHATATVTVENGKVGIVRTKNVERAGQIQSFCADFPRQSGIHVPKGAIMRLKFSLEPLGDSTEMSDVALVEEYLKALKTKE